MFITFSLFGDCKDKLVRRVVSSTLQCKRKKEAWMLAEVATGYVDFLVAM